MTVAAVVGTLLLLVLVAGAFVATVILLYRFVLKSQNTAEPVMQNNAVIGHDVLGDLYTDYEASTAGLSVGGASSGDRTSVVEHIPFNLTTDIEGPSKIF